MKQILFKRLCTAFFMGMLGLAANFSCVASQAEIKAQYIVGDAPEKNVYLSNARKVEFERSVVGYSLEDPAIATGKVEMKGLVEPGSVRVFAGALASQPSRDGATSRVNAAWSNEFVITSPTHTSGELGYFTGMIKVNGELSGVGLNRGDGTTWLQAAYSFRPHAGVMNEGNTDFDRTTQLDIGNDIGRISDGPNSFYLPFRVAFRYGTGIDFTMRAFSFSHGSSREGPPSIGGIYSMGSDYWGSGVTWGGIGGVTDAFNNPVTNFSALSSTGFDYSRAAVPEPSTGALALAGLAMGAIALRTTSRHL